MKSIKAEAGVLPGHRVHRLTRRVAGGAGDVLRVVGSVWRAAPGWATVCAVITVAVSAASVVMQVTVGHLLASVPAALRAGTGSPATDTAWTWFVVFAALTIGTVTAQAIRGWAGQRVRSRHLTVLHDAVADAGLAPSGLSLLDAPGYAGRLAGAASTLQSWQVRLGLAELWSVVQSRLTGLGALGLVISWRWWPGLLAVAATLLVGRAANAWIDRGLMGALDASSGEQRRAEYFRTLMTTSAAAKELRLFGWADWLSGRYRGRWLSANHDIWRRTGASLTPRLLAAEVALGIVVVGSLLLLARDAMAGEVSVAHALAVVQAVFSLGMLGPLGDATTGLRRFVVLLRELAALREEADLPVHSPAPDAISRPRVGAKGPASGAGGAEAASVDVDEVWFTYPTRAEPTLRGVSLQIPAGQSVAMVGVNGAGKSTLVKLLSGLYRPDRGQVRVAAVDPAAAQEAGRAAVIFQDFTRYPLTLRENVGFGAADRLQDQAALRFALHRAGGDDLVGRLPAGWDTVLAPDYSDGTDLSGGQWQRVALARALFAVHGGAGLLILDEPTAALDVRAEAALFDRFMSVAAGATTILISHRLSSVRHADRIVVLDGTTGTITEDGSHEQLIALNGQYARLFRLQAARFAQAGDPDAPPVPGRSAEGRES